jgi:hypothetical protein
MVFDPEPGGEGGVVVEGDGRGPLQFVVAEVADGVGGGAWLLTVE